jgi:CHAD domain-containing protein
LFENTRRYPTLLMAKWLPDFVPTDRAADVAAQSLTLRLAEVHRYLRWSVKKPRRIDNAHQLRVWCRRSAATLALYKDLMPQRGYRRMVKLLRRIRRAAGRVRDCDVYASRTVGPGGHWPRSLRKERDRAQRKLVALFDRLDGGRKLEKRSNKLIARLRRRNRRSTETFAERARAALQPIATAFFAAFPPAAGGERELHRFRIAGKALRYAMEPLVGAFPTAFRDELYPLFGAMQDRLGQINDLFSARSRLTKRSADTGDPAELSELRRQLAATDDDLSRVRGEFHCWWTPAQHELLRARFADVLGGPLSPA